MAIFNCYVSSPEGKPPPKKGGDMEMLMQGWYSQERATLLQHLIKPRQYQYDQQTQSITSMQREPTKGKVRPSKSVDFL